MPDPTFLGACDENLPLLPILRQFDFGQFVFLHQSAATNANATHRIGQTSRPIVIDPSGGRTQALQEWLERMQAKGVTPPGHRAVLPAGDLLGGISLDTLFAPPDNSTPVEMPIVSTALADVFDHRRVEHAGTQYTLEINAAAAETLARGEPTLVLAAADGGGTQFMTLLTPGVPAMTLDGDAVDTLLATGNVLRNGTLEHVAVDASMSRALMAGEPVVVWTNGGSNSIVRLVPPVAARLPAESNVVIEDLGEFLEDPHVAGADGMPIGLKLSAAHVQELRAGGAATIAVGGTNIVVRRSGTLRAIAAPNLIGARPVALANQNDRGRGIKGAVVPMTADGPGMPPGIKIAVFMPWRQTWTLTGFSRGELRSSLALAPQEETTIEVSSWERRLRTLDQSSETDVDQSFESTQTERATDDVFNEMTKHHDFNWQVAGSLDATYSTGNGSISVGVKGEVADASQLQSIARSTHQGMKESTQKAAANIRAIRTTHITDSIEAGSETRVTRRIKNPNFSHTLTLDFFETLVHYTVTLAAVPDRLALVALLNNPMATSDFNRKQIRTNETTLRRALLDPSLADGFDACRKTAAYEKAIGILNEQALMGAVTDNAVKPSTTSAVAKPVTSAQEKAVVELLAQIAAAYRKVSTSQMAGVAPTQFPAMRDIAAKQPVSEADLQDAQHCLFLQLCNRYLPGLRSAISAVPINPTIKDAGALAAAIPPPGATMSLVKFADVSNTDKEWAGLGNAITEIFGNGTMGWANGMCLAQNLYTANDAGLGGLVDTLWTAYKAYLAKQSEGEFQQEKDVAIATANATQDKLSTADKLAMAFPLDELASAREREEALRDHLNAHRDHYSFALFQGLSPAEQSKFIEDSGLEVGTFEPRVLAISGPELAVPLAPPPAGSLRTFIEGLRKNFATSFSGAADTPDYFIFPTPGLTINSRLGKCTACEDFIEDSRAIELRRLGAVADAAEQEAARRAARIKANDLNDFVVEATPLHVTVDRVPA